MVIVLLAAVAACSGRDRANEPSSDQGGRAGLVDLGDCPTDYDPRAGISDTEIRVASSMPLSGPAGYLGFLGTGIEAWFNYYNETRGGFDGRRLVLDLDDDAYEPTRTLENVREDIAEDTFAFLGMVGTSNNLFVWDDINAACVPHLFLMSGAAEWGANPREHPWTVGALPAYQLEMAALVQHLAAEHPDASTIAVLHQNDDLGASYLSGIETAIDVLDADLEIVATQTHERGEVQLDTQMTNLETSEADIWIGGTTGEACTNALRALGESSWAPIRYLSNTCSSTNFLDAAGPPGAEGPDLYAHGVLTGLFSAGTTDPEVVDRPGIQEYLDNVEQYAPSGKSVMPNVGLFSTGWQIGWFFTTALEQADDLTRPALMEAVRALDLAGPFTIEGVRFTLDGQDDPFGFEAVSLAEYEGPDWSNIEVHDFEGRTMDFVDPSQLGE